MELARVRDYYSQFPFIRRVAVHYGGSAQNNDLAGYVDRLADFVRERVTYVPDPHGYELVTAPDILLAEIIEKGRTTGDCDDHVLLLNTLLATVGFQTAFIGVRQPDGGLPAGATQVGQDLDGFNHVIAGVVLDGRLIDLDPTNKSGREEHYEERYVIS